MPILCSTEGGDSGVHDGVDALGGGGDRVGERRARVVRAFAAHHARDGTGGGLEMTGSREGRGQVAAARKRKRRFRVGTQSAPWRTLGRSP